MINIIVQFFKDMKTRVWVVGVAVVALLAYAIDLLMNKNSALQTQVNEVKTQKQADVLESKINQELNDANSKQVEVNANQKALDSLEQKRQELPQQKDLSAQEVEQYWKDNK